jgi:hypothetical protein
MPYIDKAARERVAREGPSSAGELNYEITQLLNRYVGPAQSYAKYNEVIGVLECAKMEFYRRAVAPYENLKCKENGDVYRPTRK